MDFSDPDGKWSPLNNNFLQTLTLPAYGMGYLVGQSGAAWEQAVVVYVDGNRQAEQMGTYRRTGIVWLGTTTSPQQIALAGWHKRSGPDGKVPWTISQGLRSGNVASWDDSGGDGDYNDYVVELVRPDGIHPLGNSPGGQPAPWKLDRPGADQDDGPGQKARVLATLANLRETAGLLPGGDTRAALERHLDSVTQAFFEQMLARGAEDSTSPLSPNVLVAAWLNLFAQAVQEGGLRTELLRLARQVLAEDKPRGTSAGGSDSAATGQASKGSTGRAAKKGGRRTAKS